MRFWPAGSCEPHILTILLSQFIVKVVSLLFHPVNHANSCQIVLCTGSILIYFTFLANVSMHHHHPVLIPSMYQMWTWGTDREVVSRYCHHVVIVYLVGILCHFLKNRKMALIPFPPWKPKVNQSLLKETNSWHYGFVMKVCTIVPICIYCVLCWVFLLFV